MRLFEHGIHRRILISVTPPAIMTALLTTSLVSSPIALAAGRDNVRAELTGAKMDGYMIWHSPDVIDWDITITDTLNDGNCANLFFAGNWGGGKGDYLGHACGVNKQFRSRVNGRSIGSQGQGRVTFTVCRDINNGRDQCAQDTNRYGGA